MSHFAVLCIVPKDEIVENPLANRHEGEDDWQNAYSNQFESFTLEEMLAPYSETDEEYMTVEISEDEFLNDVWKALKDKDYVKVRDLLDEPIQRMFRWKASASVMNTETGDFEKMTEEEIAKEMKEHTDLANELISGTFDMDSEDERQRLIDLFGVGYETIFEDDCFKEVSRYNPNAKWDWWVVGGRWRNVGDNGIIYNLQECLEYKDVPFYETLSWYQLPHCETREELEEKLSEPNAIVKDFKKDSEGKFVEDENGKYIPDTYYTKEELFATTQIRKQDFLSFLFPEEGWVEKAEMGWFGSSSLDGLSKEEKDKKINEFHEFNDNLLKKYIEDDNYIGVVVDCHI